MPEHEDEKEANSLISLSSTFLPSQRLKLAPRTMPKSITSLLGFIFFLLHNKMLNVKILTWVHIILSFYETVSEEIQIYNSFGKRQLAICGQSEQTRTISVSRVFWDSLIYSWRNTRTNPRAKMVAPSFVLIIIINRISFTLWNTWNVIHFRIKVKVESDYDERNFLWAWGHFIWGGD